MLEVEVLRYVLGVTEPLPMVVPDDNVPLPECEMLPLAEPSLRDELGVADVEVEAAVDVDIVVKIEVWVPEVEVLK